MGIAGFPLQTITYGYYELFLFNLLSTLYSGKASGDSETTFSRCVYPDPFTDFICLLTGNCYINLTVHYVIMGDPVFR